MSVAEGIHWMQAAFSIVKKSTREKLKPQLPEQFQWIADCRKSQTAACLLKLFLDQSNVSGMKILYWPQQCDCSVACDFCVYGNSNLVMQLLNPLLTEHFDLNFIAWWKRYVRFTSPRTFTNIESQKTYYCFTLVDKPDFFRSSISGGSISSSNDNNNSATIIKNLSATQPVVTNTIIENFKPPGEGEIEQLQHMKKQEEELEEEKQPKRQRSEYRCKICKLPKRNHVCRGLAPPPLPTEPEPLFLPAPPPPLSLHNPSTNTTRSDFETIFVPDTETNPKTRLQRLFGSTSIQQQTSTIEKEQINTEVDLLDN